MKTITFYSYKGGTGRTLAVANTALFLARFGHKVFVLDFDLEAPGLHYKFDLHSQLGGGPINGLVDFIQSFKRTGLIPELAPYVNNIALPPNFKQRSISLMAAGDAPSQECSRQLGSLRLQTLF